MPKLPVKGLPSGDSGRLIVRLNNKYREGIDRYGIAKITNNKNHKSFLVLVLGHNDKSAIFMPFDIRQALGVELGGSLNFIIEKVRLPGKLRWYVTAPDPAVHIPAWIAFIGIMVGFAGVVVGALSLW